MTDPTFRSLHQRCTAQAMLPSPLGPMLCVRTEAGLAGVWFDAQKWFPGAFDAPECPGDPLIRQAAAQLDEYFAGRRTVFDIPLDLHGTPFQKAVWQALLGIGSGSTWSYSDVARQVGSLQAVRAVGAAVGRNPVSIMVPCHRVIGRDGRLTGYAGGLDRKQALLRLEGVLAPAQGMLL